MKTITILLLFSLAASAQTPQRYADPENGVTFTYAAPFRPLDPAKDTHYMLPAIQPVRAALVLDDPTAYTGTDFASLAFNYIIAPVTTTAAACRAAINPYGDAAPAPSVTVNGRRFDAVNAGDAAMNHQITERLYSTFANNRCYIFDLELVTAGFGVDDTLRQMNQPERDDANKQLDTIFGTVRITTLH
jgi:hypothetical protein